MLILYVIPFMAIAALVFENALESDARERRQMLRQCRVQAKTRRGPGGR